MKLHTYKVGGCLGCNDPNYIERRADCELYRALKAGSHFIEQVLLVHLPKNQLFIFIDEIDSIYYGTCCAFPIEGIERLLPIELTLFSGF